MTLVYGVDFGTSNSSIMIGRPGGRVIRVRNPVNSSYEVPSAVCLSPDGTMEVGSVATQMKLLRPAWYRQDFKRDIADPVRYHFPAEKADDPRRGPSHRAYKLVAEVLRVLRQAAEHAVPERPGLVVLTVPASWKAGERDLMLEAADLAGFARETVRLITEPVAAVAYAAQEQLGRRERTLLIYDLGGGTFDCAVVRGRSGLDFEVLGEAGGLPAIGGAEFDQRIMSLVRERYPERWRELMEGETSDIQILSRRLQLRDTCEKAKWFLSSRDRYEGVLTGLGWDVDFVLTAGELTERLAPLIGETLDECERVLDTQGMTWDDIDGVVPVGGSVRLPAVGEMIAQRSSRGLVSVLRVDDPELAVVHGAVLHAFDLARRADAHDPPAAAPVPEEITAEEPVLVPETIAVPETTAPEPPAVPDPAPPTAIFNAANTGVLRTLWRWRRTTSVFATIAVLLLIPHLFRPFHGEALSGLRLLFTSALGVSVVSLAFTARTIRRMAVDVRNGAGMMMFSSATLVACGVTFCLWSGWWVILTVFLLVLAWMAALGGTVEVPKGRFVTHVEIRADGMVFQADHKRSARLAWDEVDAFVLDGSGLDRALSARLGVPGADDFVRLFGARPAAKQEGSQVYRLFGRFHFVDGDGLLETIRLHGGERLTGTW